MYYILYSLDFLKDLLLDAGPVGASSQGMHDEPGANLLTGYVATVFPRINVPPGKTPPPLKKTRISLFLKIKFIRGQILAAYLSHKIKKQMFFDSLRKIPADSVHFELVTYGIRKRSSESSCSISKMRILCFQMIKFSI